MLREVGEANGTHRCITIIESGSSATEWPKKIAHGASRGDADVLAGQAAEQRSLFAWCRRNKVLVANYIRRMGAAFGALRAIFRALLGVYVLQETTLRYGRESGPKSGRKALN